MWALFDGSGRFWVTSEAEVRADWEAEGRLSIPVISTQDVGGTPMVDIIGRLGCYWYVRDTEGSSE